MGIDFSVERTCANCKYCLSMITAPGQSAEDVYLCEASKHFLRNEKQYRITGQTALVYNSCKNERKDWTIAEKIQNRLQIDVPKRCGPDGSNFKQKDQLVNKPIKTLGNTLDMTRAPELARVVDLLKKEGCNQEDAERITEEISDIIYNKPADVLPETIVWADVKSATDSNVKHP